MPRKKKPHNPAAITGSGQAAHRRMAASHDLPYGAKVRPVEIDDPYEAGAKIIALRSIRDDVLARLRCREQITEAQFIAGRHWQYLYECAEIGGARAMDPTREPVDGSPVIPDPITDGRKRAVLALAQARVTLGQAGYGLIEDVLGRGMDIQGVARKRGVISAAGIKHIGWDFRNQLDALAEAFGMVARGR